ncbi:MAG: CvpA family protein [Clostridia bacterium]|nr:CvpA family protein [Clostridia bacterium]
MGIILDIILVVILAGSIFLGYKKGLVKVAVSLFALIISLVVTLVLYRPISNAIINNTDWDEKIEQIIIENTTKKVEETNQNGNILEDAQKYIDNAVAEGQNNVVENVAPVIAERVISIGTMIILFIATRLVLILLTLVSNVITNLPIIKQFNELGGVIYGIVRGLIVVYALLAIAFFIVSMSSNINITNAIDSSFITKFMYSHNILLNIIF